MNITIATYGKLMNYDISRFIESTIKTNSLYYGTIKIEDRIVTIYRPDMELNSTNYLEIISQNLTTLSIIEIDSKHTHEMILNPNRDIIYIISTNDGILYLLNKETFTTIRTIKLGNSSNHINTIAIKNTKLYCIFHNRGLSDVVIFDINNNFTKIRTYQNIGVKCHNIVFYKKGFLYLNSDAGELCYFNEETNNIDILVDFNFLREKKFLKGLLLINNYAFIGLSNWGSRKERYSNNSDLTCIDIYTKKILWIKQVTTNGLLNSITLLSGHNYIQNIVPNTEYSITYPGLLFDFIKFPKSRSMETIKRIGFYPVKYIQNIVTPILWDTNVYPFKNHFQPQIRNDKSIILIFCNGSGTKFYRTSYWYEYSKYVLPIINYIFGSNKLNHIARLQFALLRKNEIVNFHTDQNYWAKNYHRIHICIHTNNNVINYHKINNNIVENFINEGEIIEFNNKIPHSVENKGNTDRINIILDYSEKEIDSEFIYLDKTQIIDL